MSVKNMVVRFVRRMLQLPVAVRVWTGMLVAANGIVPLFFLGRGEARVVLLSFLVSLALMVGTSEKFGFTRLLGLAHVVWLPLIVYLWARMGAHPAVEAFGAWIRLVMLLNTAALIMDAADVVRYLRGDRAEIVAGAS